MEKDEATQSEEQNEDCIMYEFKHLTAGRMQILGLLRKIDNNSTPVLAGADY